MAMDPNGWRSVPKMDADEWTLFIHPTQLAGLFITPVHQGHAGIPRHGSRAVDQEAGALVRYRWRRV